jgi:signal transduction histidine kinase
MPPLRPTGAIALLQRRPRILIIVFTASVLAFVVALQVVHSIGTRRRALEGAQTRAANLAYVLSEYVRGSFAVTDQSLRQLLIHARRVGGPRAGAEEWDPILAAAKAALPGGGSITVTDADGRIVHSTQPVIIGASRRDNYIFKRLSTLNRDELVVDRPFPTVVQPSQYVIPIGRRLTNREGRFDGTVVAVLLPERYREFFRTADVGREGMTWVFHPEGVVLFREPSTTNPINEAAASNPILRAAQHSGGDGIFSGPLQPGGPAFVSAYRVISEPPLIVGVSLSVNEILADWYRQRRSAAFALGALALTLGCMVFVMFREMNARATAEQDLIEVQQLKTERLRNTNEALEQALENEQKARREIEAASYLKDEFLMTVSHELRTPLTAIYGWVRVLVSKEMPREQQLRALAAVERNAIAQTRLIDDLLDVSRAIVGKLRIDARLVNIARVLDEATDTLLPALTAKSIEFTSRIEPEMEPVFADPIRLQQIVWNLLSNAIKFTPPGGTVELRASRVGSHVEIAVSDSGAGISPDFLPFVFERFRQADAGTRRRYGGLGLGLAIVRHLTELHGGTVTADSAGEDKGSTFRVLLPLKPPSPVAAAPETEQAVGKSVDDVQVF